MTNDDLAWRGIDAALDLLGQWYEANEGDYSPDEQTNHEGMTMRELADAIEAASDLASRRGRE